MARQSLVSSAANPRANAMTTLFASGWGLIAAYVLFSALCAQIEPKEKFLAFLATLFPIIAVWATIERKRWGRLALFGLSTTAIGLSVAGVAMFAALKSNGNPLDEIANSLPSFLGASVFAALILLAIINAFWLRRPTVVAEFERNKQAKLAITQRIIATTLVGCWGVTMVLAPYVSNTQPFERVAKAAAKSSSTFLHAPRIAKTK